MVIENEQKRINALKRLQAEMNKSGVINQFIEKGENGSPFEILACEHVGIKGQFYFPVMAAAENVFYFSCMMVLKDSVGKKEAAALREKLQEVNMKLVCGMFIIYPEVGLVYRLTIPVSETLEEDDIFETINIAAAHALALSATFAPDLT